MKLKDGISWEGKKTYILSLIGIGYLIGTMLGKWDMNWYGFDILVLLTIMSLKSELS